MTESKTAGERPQVEALPRILLVGTPDTMGWFGVVSSELNRRDRWSHAENPDAVLVLVSPQFAAGLDEHPMRPLIAAAMNDGRPVIPLLVDGATMPDAAGLPADLAPLAHYQALELGSPKDVRIVVARAVLRCAKASSGATEPSSRPKRRPTVFLAYRRDDTSQLARLLSDEFVAQLGDTHVFLDVGSQQPGDDYTTRIGDALRRATDIVVLVGPGFLYPETDGTTRLSDPDDLLRHEIRTGFDKGKRVHLVLIDKAEVPDAPELPDDLSRLTRIKSVHKVRTVNEIPKAVGAIIEVANRRDSAWAGRFGVASNWSRQSFAPLRLPATGTSSGATDRLAAGRGYEVVRREHATSVAAEITAAGWRDVTPRRQAREMIRLVHVATGRYRLEISLTEAQVWLDERIHSARRAGLPDWVTREGVPIPPGDLSLRHQSRLPDKLVLIAVDPDEYLEQRGRYRLKRRTHPSRGPRVYSPVGQRSLERRVPINAVEEYQRTQREVRSCGGLTTMEFGGQLTLEVDEEWGLDFCPNGALAVGVTGGVAVCGTDFDSWELRTTRTPVQALACARDGRLAALSGRGDLTIWNSEGAALVERRHAFMGFNMRSKLRSYRSLGSLAWSTDGRFLAAGDDVAVWLYDTNSDQIRHWRPRTAVSSMDTCRVGFLNNSGELVASAGRGAICVLGVPDLAPRRVIERTWKGGHPISDHSDAKLVGPPLAAVHQLAVAPDGSVVAVGYSDGQIALHDPATLERVSTAAWFPPHQAFGEGDIDAVAFDSTGDRLAAVAVEFPHSNRLLVGRTDGLVPDFQSPVTIEGGRCALAWAPSGSRLAVRNWAREILLFDLPDTCHEG